MKNAVSLRISQWHNFRGFISMRAKFLFLENLGKRGFNGKLKLFHRDSRLELRVILFALKEKIDVVLLMFLLNQQKCESSSVF